MISIRPLASRYAVKFKTNLPNPTSFLHSLVPSTSNSSLQYDIENIFRILNSSIPSRTLNESLRSSGVFVSKDLIDEVLKRVRFNNEDPLKALEFFRYAGNRKDSCCSALSLDTMLDILGRRRKFDQIWEILKEMKGKNQFLVSPRTMQVVLARIAKLSSVRQCVESFWKFQRYVPEFDTTCFNTLLRILCQEKSMTDARDVYRRLKQRFRPDLQTFNILLSGCKSSEEAEAFFLEMRQMNVKPDIVAYNSLIDEYCKDKGIEKVHKLVDKMREEDVTPDVITYTSVIGGLGLIGQPDKAREILKEMKEYGCYPDVAAYNAAIRNYCIAKRLGDAYSLVEEMERKGLTPDATTYNLFLRIFCWANDLRRSWSLYERMMSSGCLPNTQTCMLLIKLFRRQERVDMAMRLWDDMVAKGFGSYGLVSVVLFDLLCDMGKIEEAKKCLLEIVEKGHRPSHASFKRIKVLMELAKRNDELKMLQDKIKILGSSFCSCENGESFLEA